MFGRRVTVLVKRFYSDYIVKSPYSEITVPEVTIDQLIWQNIAKWENKTAVECGKTGKQMTYKELRQRSKSFASNLSSLGLTGETALMVLPNCPEFPLALLGSLEAGMTISGANPIYTSGELKHQAKDSGAKVVITSPDCLEAVRSAELGIPIICTGEEKLEGVHSFNQMTKTTGKNIPDTERRLKQLALLPYSSGTTGLPKGVRLSQRNIVANILQITHPEMCAIQEASGDHQDTLPAVLPFFHIYGAVIIMLRGLYLGTKLVTLPSFEPPAFINILRSNKNIVLHAVPPIINFLACRSEVKSEYLEGLRHTMTAAAPCSADDLQKLNEKKAHTIYQAYGLTESSPGLTFPPLTCTNKSTVGFPLSNTQGQVIDPTNGKPLPPGIRGEVCFRGPQIMEGYHNRPEATADTVDSEGWLHTGDIGYADDQGQFYIVDRIKELIKVKGFQVAPAELEALLRQHPSVLDVGVTAASSVKHGELPVAFVVPKPGQVIEQSKVLDWMGKQIAPYKKPAKIMTVPEIPKSSAGKILRRKLKDIAKDMKLD